MFVFTILVSCFMAVAFCVQYSVAVWFAVDVPWSSAVSSLRAFNTARILALAVPPAVLVGGIVLIRRKRPMQGKALLALSLAALLGVNWHVTQTYVVLSAPERDVRSQREDFQERQERQALSRKAVEPLLGDIPAYAMEIEEIYGIHDYVRKVRFRTDDLDRLKEGLKSHGWTFDGTGWQRQKMLAGVGGSCVLWYYRDKTDDSWVVQFSEVR